jgi:FKBP-type peptidyl-prolyl cis-trans isomerase SlyD
METNQKPFTIADDVVVSLDYTLTVDGELVDASEENEPIVFLQGYQNIIPGLEKELYGLAVGDSREVTVAPKEGYGEIDPQAIMDIPRSQFPKDIELKNGLELSLQQPDGHVLHATVTALAPDTVTLDFNHPLAGKELTFRVTVINLRVASDEEKSHGHVHGQHSHHGSEEEDLGQSSVEPGEDD